MTEPSRSDVEISLGWAYKNPHFATRSFDTLADQYGEDATYTLDDKRHGFVKIIARRIPDSEPRNENWCQHLDQLEAYMNQCMGDYIESYRAENSAWMMEEMYKARIESLEIMVAEQGTPMRVRSGQKNSNSPWYQT